jgi:5'-nucleotidase
MLRILMTNDDGIQSPLLEALAAQLAPRCELLVAAPDRNRGATSHSVTLHKPVRAMALPDYAAAGSGKPTAAYAISGTPADCVMLGLHHFLKDNPPHLVISGINRGENVAEDLSYSGTVGAALEAAANAVPAIALSDTHYDRRPPEEAARIAEAIITQLLYGASPEHLGELITRWQANANQRSLWPLSAEWTRGNGAYPAPDVWPAGMAEHVPCININLPGARAEDIRGVMWARAGHREYRDVVKHEVDPRGKAYYWVAGDKVLEEDLREDTDTFAIANGIIAATPMTYDRTAITRLEEYITAG